MPKGLIDLVRGLAVTFVAGGFDGSHQLGQVLVHLGGHHRSIGGWYRGIQQVFQVNEPLALGDQLLAARGQR